MNYPAELRYTQEHEWVRVEGDVAIIGITHHAQESLGDIVYLEVSATGEVAQHGVFGVVEAVKAASDLFMPVSGTIIEVNKALDTDPSLVNTDPYGDGWMIKVKMSNTDEIAGLLLATDYQAIIA